MHKLLLAFLLLFGINAFANDDALWEKSTLNQIIKKGELVVGTDAGYMPFEMKNKRGEVIGFDIDIARAMADAMGVKLKVVPTDFDGLVTSLMTKKFDIIMAGMTITSERNLKISFSKPYTNIGQTFLVNKKHANKKWQELDKPEYTIVTKIGVTGEFVAKRVFKKAKIKTFQTEAEAVQEVINGNADAWIYDKPYNIVYMAEKGKDLLVHIDEDLTSEPLGIGFRKGDPDFENWLNNFLNQIKHDGTYERIYEKWFRDTKWFPQVM